MRPYRVFQYVVVPRGVHERDLKRHGEPNRRGCLREAKRVRVAGNVGVFPEGNPAEELKQGAHVSVHHLLKIRREPHLRPLTRTHAVHPRHDDGIAPSRRHPNRGLLREIEPVPDVELDSPAQHGRELSKGHVRKRRRLKLVQPAHDVLVLATAPLLRTVVAVTVPALSTAFTLSL